MSRGPSDSRSPSTARAARISRRKHLLHAASLAQAGESGLAERALRTALLSSSGAEFALGPLEGLGELFTETRLLFRRRQATMECLSRDDAVQAWTPAESSRSIH